MSICLFEFAQSIIRHQMYHLILATAERDKRVLAVYMNGSRTNVNVPKDIFQDFDIVFVVMETAGFIYDTTWIKKFGEILYMQYPDESPYYTSDKENVYGWLIQFADGNRLDLHVETVKHAREHIGDDKLCKILLDKNAILPDMHESMDKDYWVKKPTKEQYLCVCNEFWWCLNNVAKGLWREEIPYVQDMVNYHVRKQLEKMLSWKVGILTDFTVSVGKSGKYMYQWIEKKEWETYLSTYFTGRVSEAWEAVMIMCNLFGQTAIYVGDRLEFNYNELEGKNARGFLEHVRQLPKNAKKIY
ncbi:aminoglycoside 6-adenylyltransferase [Clostridium sp. E02]|uniref:aminoglycoside 6-adenylyltransferase n=1 Tax=Clostridium sp. E02 TaxID=2487134 RepID=UPI000F538DE4|nr:aminoglycoside 6-adenylyltransferase [Clostridium sp. E02]